MTAYRHYQPSIPGWGTDQLGAPPPVGFQPQPSWRGIDFFRAHSSNVDPSLYYRVYDTVNSGNRPLTALGISLNEARLWHHRAYGGVGTANALSPNEIGYASAYEAYRLWIHNSTLYEPLGGEHDRQREALIGLAVAEASKLYNITQPHSPQGQIVACEAAAASASLIFQEVTYGAPSDAACVRGYPHSPRIGSYSRSPNIYPSGGAGGVGAPYPSEYPYNNDIDNGAVSPGEWSSDPYAVDYAAPFLHRRMSLGPYSGEGLPRSSSPSPVLRSQSRSSYHGADVLPGHGTPYIGGPGSSYTPRLGTPSIGGPRSSYTPRLGTPSIGGARSSYTPRLRTPSIGGPRSSYPSRVGTPNMGALMPHGTSMSMPTHTAYPSTGSPAPPVMYSPATGVPSISTFPGQSVITQLPQQLQRRRSTSGRHHHHRAKRSKSVDHIHRARTPDRKLMHPATDAVHKFGNAVGGLIGGTAGLVGGAVNGFARGAAGGLTQGVTAGSRLWPSDERGSWDDGAGYGGYGGDYGGYGGYNTGHGYQSPYVHSRSNSSKHRY